MALDSRTETRRVISPKRLWFGFATAAGAWLTTGTLNVFLAWQACLGGEAGTGVFTSAWFRVMLGFITFGLLAISIFAGVISYRNWQRLSRERELMEAEANPRPEFMALCGVFVSASLGMGIALFAIPVYILGICVRTR